jgi:hypothetical protein
MLPGQRSADLLQSFQQVQCNIQAELRKSPRILPPFEKEYHLLLGTVDDLDRHFSILRSCINYCFM